MDKELFEATLLGGDTHAICNTLVDMTFDSQTDYQWLERRCADLMQNYPKTPVRSLAATCLGHIARITGSLSEETVAILRRHVNDESLDGTAGDALDDWSMFVGRNTQGDR